MSEQLSPLRLLKIFFHAAEHSWCQLPYWDIQQEARVKTLLLKLLTLFTIYYIQLLFKLLSVCNYANAHPKWSQTQKFKGTGTTLLKCKGWMGVSTFPHPGLVQCFTCPCVSWVSWAIVSFTWPCWGRGGGAGVCGWTGWGAVPELVMVFCPLLEEAVLVLETAVETGWPLIIWVTTCCVWPVREVFELKNTFSAF